MTTMNDLGKDLLGGAPVAADVRENIISRSGPGAGEMQVHFPTQASLPG
ncbi:MAG: hypothetical protein ACJ8AW_24040 [Rhodopila sp.]|jgi:hypothetical protein